LDRELAHPVHRIAGVDCEIEHRVLKLGRIGECVPQALRNDRLHLDTRTDASPEQVFHSADEPPGVDDLRLKRLTSSECEELAGKFCTALHAGHGIGYAPFGLAAGRNSACSSWRLPEIICRRLLKSCA